MGWGPCDIGLQYSKFPIECYFCRALKQETQKTWTTANKWYKYCCFSFAFETIISIGQAVLESYSHKQFLFPGPSHIWNSKYIDAKLLGFRTWRPLAATYQKSTKRTHTAHKHLRGLGSQHPKTNKIHMLKAYLSNQKNAKHGWQKTPSVGGVGWSWSSGKGTWSTVDVPIKEAQSLDPYTIVCAWGDHLVN